MKRQKIFLTGIFSFIQIFLFISPVVAQEKIITINEFVPNADQEWVEFYNKGNSSVDLVDYYFDDDDTFMIDGQIQTGTSDPGSDPIKLSGVLQASIACYLDLTSYLNDGGDTPSLFLSNGSTIDSYTYTSTQLDKSYSRVPDGADWQADQTPTKSSNRCADLASTPTPTPTPSPTTPASIDTPIPPTATPPTSYSNIYINEFLADPESGSEKVEIKNGNSFPVSLVNWKIDDVENDGKDPKPFSADISPSGLFTIDLGTASFLNNDGDSVRLLDFNDSQKDKRDYSSSSKNQSWSKDRSGNWCQQSSSFNAENSDCPSAATSVPTSVPTPTSMPTSKVSPTLMPSPTIKPTDGEILGEEDTASDAVELAADDATDSSLPDSEDATVAGVAKSNKSLPSWPFIGAGSVFFAAMVGSAVLVVKKKLPLP